LDLDCGDQGAPYHPFGVRFLDSAFIVNNLQKNGPNLFKPCLLSIEYCLLFIRAAGRALIGGL
jgi:hypothetical protein